MEKITIDINCDVGEGVGNEHQLFPYISSCNIACGGHAGDPVTMQEIIRLAVKEHVKIGAHPSYPDRENFGRKSLKMSPAELSASISNQLELFMSILKSEESVLHHIKAHGALYNDLAGNPQLSGIYLDAVSPFLGKAKIYVPFGSAIAELALSRGIPIAYEAFADRNYNSDLSLVSRSLPGALISEPERAMEHLVYMVKNDRVKTPSGEYIPIKAETFCIHGDTPSALQILMYLVAELPKHNIFIEK